MIDLTPNIQDAFVITFEVLSGCPYCLVFVPNMRSLIEDEEIFK